MPSGREVAAIAAAHSDKGTDWGVGYCLKFSRTCAGAKGGVLNAITAWRQAKHRHAGGVPPKGSFVFWEGGSAGHGHVAVSDGDGFVWSTDIKRRGLVDRVSIAYVGAKWPNQRLVGWSEDINGVRVTLPVIVPAVKVQLGVLRPGQKNTYVERFQRALRAAGYGKLNPSGVTGYYGDETVAMCKAYQQAHPVLRRDADGVPGPKTAALLGLHVI